MSPRHAPSTTSIQLFVPAPRTTYAVDIAAHLSGMPRHRVLRCCRHGLVSPHVDPGYGAMTFDMEAIRTLQHIEHLRQDLGINWAGIGVIINLLGRIDRMENTAGTTRWRTAPIQVEVG